jgi:adenylate kinase family enzyme
VVALQDPDARHGRSLSRRDRSAIGVTAPRSGWDHADRAAVAETRGVEHVAVVGGPGSGKSTVARALGLPVVELDALWWEPGWKQAPLHVFQHRVRDAVAADRWVIEGFYVDEAMVPIVWPRAEVIVWLDRPRWRSVARALRRSFWRCARRTELWNGNRQSWSVLSPRSIVRLWRRWPTYPATIETALADRPHVRLRSDAEVTAWLASVT